MLEALFFGSLLLIFYTYLGYPLAAACLGMVVRREVSKGGGEPSVTVVIAAYNEAQVIAATVENKLALDYPRERLEIMVVSDGSTDGTDAIVAGFADRGVRLMRQEPRAGKTSALNLAIPLARGEIVVFSDANSLYAPDALKQVVANFADPSVGYVTGQMVYANEEGTGVGEGCGAYMRYENLLRALETRVGSVVGVDGGIDAVRASLYRPMGPDLLPDFVLPLRVVEQGYRVVYEPKALLCEQALKEDADEYRMRVRVSLRAFWALWEMRTLLNPLRYPLFSWQLFSHKVLRYLCFVFLAVAYLANAMLLGGGWPYRVLFLAQNVLYLLALCSRFLERAGYGSRLLSLGRYFCLLNIAAAHACGKFLLGKKQVLWAPRKG
ncbi:glycosyltransferase family 2 protein [Geomonas nitrogeniifigens]|uniref:Glycosyltransferase family 2 protein n=1 Tax=Geomonas diazotrophica TaxID=2843197 RepID=A0ABX8JEF2_9BACT|nr:glycosyltransferase family 2 protein [Geomonas nitrogeniifigens]QWV95852.1 glycosyltransferase family 2 protein [Geomonas nitrogeniifigens]QXE84937.1 glycosyltransferase family 2 protein [Geomonas nitrogeniifigens]